MEQILPKKIILQAVKSFRNQGVISTSLRQIAKELNISDGHLRYYFKTKEDLIIAVYEEMLALVRQIEPSIPQGTPLWKDIIIQFETTFTIQTQFSGLFIDSYQLFQKYPRLRKMNQEIRLVQKNYFIEENKKNIQKGIFNSSFTDHRLHILQEQLTIIIDYWILHFFTNSKKNRIDSKVIKHFVAISLGLFLPYFDKKVQGDIELWIIENKQE